MMELGYAVLVVAVWQSQAAAAYLLITGLSGIAKSPAEFLANNGNENFFSLSSVFFISSP